MRGNKGEGKGDRKKVQVRGRRVCRAQVTEELEFLQKRETLLIDL